uniref:AT1G65230-like protein n=1 Tax=Kalanchoe fedtschenkoi TaxID=63787 RepID=A0A7N0VHY2_KALFE
MTYLASPPPPPPLLSATLRRDSRRRFPVPSPASSRCHPIKVVNDGKRMEGVGVSEGDRIVDGMDFGELCDEFECKSSPLVESTARQLVRDILELREGNRALGTFAISVKYKDPVRSFSGREKYKRPLWTTDALEKPSVSVQEMVMPSTSVLTIRWTIKGKPKSFVATISGEVVIKIKSQFTLNQISGQVIEHEESWDLSGSSAIAQAYFWTSRRIYATAESGKDLVDSVKDLAGRMSSKQENLEIYPDPAGDPTKFFQTDDGFQRDVYQLALLGAVLYLIVQFLRTTL